MGIGGLNSGCRGRPRLLERMMSFLVDAQLPPALARFLEAHGQVFKAPCETGLCDADDTAIWTFAQASGWVVVTKDEDFAERYGLTPFPHMPISACQHVS